jgi:hypothetical protein
MYDVLKQENTDKLENDNLTIRIKTEIYDSRISINA